jgi:hypothetical protein
MSTIQKQSLAIHIQHAVSMFFNNLHIFGIVTLLVASIDTFLFYASLHVHGLKDLGNIFNSAEGQSNLIKLSFTYLGFMLVYKAILGPIVSILVVVYARAFAMKSSMTVSTAINFALKRYGAVFVPYLLAMLSIQIGMIIIIPGVMFMMQYAYVDAVATLEKEAHVLSRSKLLTKSRRQSLIILILPYILLGQAIQFVEFGYAESTATLIAANAAYEGLLVVIMATFYMLYHERTALIAQYREAKKVSENQTDSENAEANE